MKNNREVKIFLFALSGAALVLIGVVIIAQTITGNNNCAAKYVPASVKRWEYCQKIQLQEEANNFNSSNTSPTSTPVRIVVEGISKKFSTRVPKVIINNTNSRMIDAISKQTSATSAAITTSPIASTSDMNYKYGMSIGETFNELSDEELNNRFDDLVSLGFGWLRFDIDWSHVQSASSTSYNWQDIDRLVAAANAHNFKILPILDFTPSWARPATCLTSSKCAPDDPSQFASFAVEAVKRYSPQGVNTWEIWNEPNIKFFWRPAANASKYAELLKVTQAAIKKQDPSARIISGGLAPATTGSGNIAPVDFLISLYQANAGSYFDAVGFHPYCFPVLPSYYQSWNAWSQMSNTVVNLRSVMVANSDANKLIWLTEFGAPTGGPGAIADTDNYNLSANPDHVTENLQAATAQDAMNSVRGYSWAGPLFWYSYKDLGTTSDTIENFFGLLRYDGTKKPAFDVLKNMIAAN